MTNLINSPLRAFTVKLKFDFAELLIASNQLLFRKDRPKTNNLFKKQLEGHRDHQEEHNFKKKKKNRAISQDSYDTTDYKCHK